MEKKFSIGTILNLNCNVRENRKNFKIDVEGMKVIQVIKVRLSPSKKIFLFTSMIALQKTMRNDFYLIILLKALFVLKVFKFLSWLFGHVEKMAWFER